MLILHKCHLVGMLRPNYQDASIVNLMGSIAEKFGSCATYPPLKDFRFDDSTRSVLLIVLDGVGYEIIKNMERATFLKRHMKDQMTSVFPSTTSASLTSFGTGVAPQQHGITGWFVYLKELGVISKVLPFSPRYCDEPFSTYGIDPSIVFSCPPFIDSLPVESYYITRDVFACSDFTRSVAGSAHIVPYSCFEGFVDAIESTVSLSSCPKYIYAYWPYFDTLGHLKGLGDEHTMRHLQEIDSKLGALFERLEGQGISVVVTADHGMIDVAGDSRVVLGDHETLKSSLVMPLSGEARGPYCYVRPSRVDAFEHYVESELSQYCDLVKSGDMVDSGLFGLGEANAKLYDRIGDYTLVMKDSYVMLDALEGESITNMKGFHGGLSRAEVAVPLIHMTL